MNKTGRATIQSWVASWMGVAFLLFAGVWLLLHDKLDAVGALAIGGGIGAVCFVGVAISKVKEAGKPENKWERETPTMGEK